MLPPAARFHCLFTAVKADLIADPEIYDVNPGRARLVESTLMFPATRVCAVLSHNNFLHV